MAADPASLISFRGRGSAHNPPNRFEKLHIEPDPDVEENPTETVSPKTQFYKDATCSILTHNDSPDVGFDTSVNPYRGCEHGCIYCYARPTHEYLGLSAGLDFESKILVKENAPELLRAELSSPRWKPRVVVMSGVTDCYQPVERRLRITRRCLEVFAEFRNPVAIITKNHLVTRDLDVLQELARHNAAAVNISVTTLDPEIGTVMEPRASLPQQRLKAIETLASAGIPTTVMVAPVVPGLTDHEMPKILQRAAEAGAYSAGYVVMRLPFAVKDLFERWVETHFPLKKDKILGRIRSLRDGKLNDPNFGSRMRGEGIFAEQIEQMFEVGCRKAGLNQVRKELSTAAFRRVERDQLSLF
jgi:DNA repair photolyase